MATTAFAQAEPGDIGVFCDMAGTQTTCFPPSFVTNNLLYVVGFDLGGVAGYEYGLVWDPRLIIFNTAITPPTGINLGPAPTNFIVGTGACLDGAGAFVLTTFTYGEFTGPPNNADMTVCLTPSTPSSFLPASPGWLDCIDNLIPFGIAASGLPDYADGCAVINPTGTPPIATEQASWGAVKSQF
jgi:hypothetical protein